MQKYHVILEELQKLKDEKYGVFLHIQERAKKFAEYSKSHSVEELENTRQVEAFTLEISKEVTEHTFEVTKKLSSMLNNLSESELVALVSATDSEYRQWGNGEEFSLLDHFGLKKQIFKYIINPSGAVVNAHEKHCQYTENI